MNSQAAPLAGPQASRSDDSNAVIGQAVSVLVVDDEVKQRKILAEILELAGYQVETASGVDEALDRLGRGDDIRLVITDLKMPGRTGLDLLAEVKARSPRVEVVLMTAFSSVETAVEAMRRGAFHYLPKPFSKEDLLGVVEQISGRVRLRLENEKLKTLVNDRFSYHRMLGRAPAMQEVFDTIEKVHSNSATVLIRGESGTGKELVARAVHASGSRRDKPFVAINCAAIPESLIESELFGHDRGAFTGATSSKMGRFEEVADGTLFLDEIGSMQFDLQSKLLRVIQEKEFQRIGGPKMLQFRARIIAATSLDLEEMMQENRFRPDLYFRLNVVPIELPSLREREGDLLILARHFLEKYNRELEHDVQSFSPETVELLEAYSWPGNVRELENVVQRMVVLAGVNETILESGSLPKQLVEAVARLQAGRGVGVDNTSIRSDSMDSLFLEAGDPADADASVEAGDTVEAGDAGFRFELFRLPPEGVKLSELEASLIRQALGRVQGRLEPAARLLGITYKTLQYRIKKYGLQDLQR